MTWLVWSLAVVVLVLVFVRAVMVYQKSHETDRKILIRKTQ
jgi:hypothetical protein